MKKIQRSTTNQKANRTMILGIGLSIMIVIIIGLMLYEILMRRVNSHFYIVLSFMILLLVGMLAFYYIIIIKKNIYDAEVMAELDQTKSYIQEIQLQKRREQLNALQNQINPHFLYNTLDTIRGLAIEKDAMDVADMVATLSAMFKYSMDYSNSVVTVNDERSHLCSFIKIQSMRFANKFVFQEVLECEFQDMHHALMPKLVLQPIVENAFSHAFKNMLSGGKITVRYIASDVNFKIIVSDNGIGIEEGMVVMLNKLFCSSGDEQKRRTDIGQSGIALYNIHSRIKMYCGEQYGLHISSTRGYGTDITLFLPMQGETNEA